jgi:cytochrome c
MKRVLSLLSTLALLAAGSAFAGAGEDLITQQKCSKCHTATTTKKAPSFASVAKKYQGDAAAPAKLAEMLKTGGNDHDKVAASDADLKAAVAVVLSSK